jgi:NAD(P)-dependent dehydrogenase (short-subunit alcohol dehydrogenase family)
MSGGEKPRVLVVGARPGSLGDAVREVANLAGYQAYTAGIAGETVELDVVQETPEAMAHKLLGLQPQHIVCTVGMNLVKHPDESDQFDWYRWHFETNVIGPMRLLDAWIVAMADGEYLPYVPLGQMLHYVAISSNSARIPRTGSAAYCASKAALSMAVRVAAREGVGGNGGYLVYGYEPGLLAGTPMTEKTAEAFPDQALHRMRGTALAAGVQVRDAAQLIVANLGVPGAGLNGCLIPIDGGEV